MLFFLIFTTGGRNYNYEERYGPDLPGKEAGHDARVWKIYLDEAEGYDDDMIRGFRDTADTMLVFAALFSAVITAFAIQASTALLPDHNLIMTHQLKEQILILRAGVNSTAIAAIPPSVYQPETSTHSTLDALVTALFFVSLALSLAVALTSVLVKQWLQGYTAVTLGTAKERALVRHFKFEGIKQWKLRQLVAALPLVIHVSFWIFAAGFILFVCGRHRMISWMIVGIWGLFMCLYTLAINHPAFYPNSPFGVP
ncbi:hypothetical protein DL96DRAFT_1473270, partial [Flagelloscypha sp. PMI_526]